MKLHEQIREWAKENLPPIKVDQVVELRSGGKNVWAVDYSCRAVIYTINYWTHYDLRNKYTATYCFQIYPKEGTMLTTQKQSIIVETSKVRGFFTVSENTFNPKFRSVEESKLALKESFDLPCGPLRRKEIGEILLPHVCDIIKVTWRIFPDKYKPLKGIYRPYSLDTKFPVIIVEEVKGKIYGHCPLADSSPG